MASDLGYTVVRWREYRQQLSQPGGGQESCRRNDMGAESTKVSRREWGRRGDSNHLKPSENT